MHIGDSNNMQMVESDETGLNVCDMNLNAFLFMNCLGNGLVSHFVKILCSSPSRVSIALCHQITWSAALTTKTVLKS